MIKDDIFDKKLAMLEQTLETLSAEYEKLPDGSLWSENRNGKLIFYNVEDTAGRSRHRKTITSNTDMISKLARKAYLETEIRMVKENIALLKSLSSSYMRNYQPHSYEDVLENMNQCKNRRAFLEGYKIYQAGLADNHNNQIALDRYSPEIIRWANAPYIKSNYMPENLIHKTSRGLMTRSKSEALITERFYANLIPSRYEEVIHTPGGILIPDFIVPSVSGKLYYWEHAGIPEKPEYWERHQQKLEKYKSIGIVPWKNLIVTYDDGKGGLDLSLVDSEIKNKLL